MVVIAANLALGGQGEVALPSLAHDRFGAAGYGALLACFAAGAVIGTLAAARTGGLRRPVAFASAVMWTPPALLGRVMSAIMLCAFGSFPLSVAVAGLLVRHIGPALFFPVAGAVLAVSVLGGLTQREFRDFGAAQEVPAADTTARSGDIKKAAT